MKKGVGLEEGKERGGGREMNQQPPP